MKCIAFLKAFAEDGKGTNKLLPQQHSLFALVIITDLNRVAVTKLVRGALAAAFSKKFVMKERPRTYRDGHWSTYHGQIYS